MLSIILLTFASIPAHATAILANNGEQLLSDNGLAFSSNKGAGG